MTGSDDMQRLWTLQDDKLDRLMSLNTRALHALAHAHASPALQRFERGQWFASCVWAAILLGLGSFAADHHHKPILVVSAMLAGLYAVWMLHMALRQALYAHDLDFSAPVTRLLEKTGALRIDRIRQTQIAILAGSAVWAPFFVVICKAALDIEITSAAWLLANIALGVALVPVWYWLARRFGPQSAASPVLRRLADNVAGRNLNEALQALADLAIFTRDEPGEPRVFR